MTGRLRDYRTGDLPTGTAVVVFGAGDVAQLLTHALTGDGLSVSWYCDPIADPAAPRTLLGRPVRPLGDLAALDPQTTVVFDAWDHTRYARQGQVLDGFSRRFVGASKLVDVDLSGAPGDVNPGERTRRAQHYREQCRALPELGAQRLVLRSLDVVVTEACSMRCIDCSNLMQYYAHPRHSDIDRLLAAVELLQSASDGIGEFRVLGGEPFVNPRVGRVIAALNDVADSRQTIIYTNATIIPREDALAAMQHEKVLVKITDYGEHSRRHDDLCSVLSSHGIAWLSQRPTWTDSGRIGLIERTPAELQRTFRDCCVNDLLTLLNEKLYLCPFSANAANLGAVAPGTDEVVDLSAPWSAPALREKVRALYERSAPLSACAFCRGRDQTTPEVTPAIQTRRPLPMVSISAGRPFNA